MARCCRDFPRPVPGLTEVLQLSKRASWSCVRQIRPALNEPQPSSLRLFQAQGAMQGSVFRFSKPLCRASAAGCWLHALPSAAKPAAPRLRQQLTTGLSWEAAEDLALRILESRSWGLSNLHSWHFRDSHPCSCMAIASKGPEIPSSQGAPVCSRSYSR